MSADTSLSSIIVAIASSLGDAQQKLEEQQVRNLLNYFKRKEGRKGFFPRRLKIQLPSLRPNAQRGETDTFCVPYISLIPHTGLKIDQAEVAFSVTIGNLNEDVVPRPDISPDNLDAPEALMPGSLPELSVDIGGAFGKKNGLAADIKVTVSGVDMAEGAARMINELIKCAQGYKTDTVPVADAPAESGQGPVRQQ